MRFPFASLASACLATVAAGCSVFPTQGPTAGAVVDAASAHSHAIRGDRPDARAPTIPSERDDATSRGGLEGHELRPTPVIGTPPEP